MRLRKLNTLKKTNKAKPHRKCIGCGNSFPKDSLIRVSLYEDKLTVDLDGRAKGRGVYFCNSQECVSMASKKKALCRAYKRKFSQEMMEKVFQKVDEIIE